MMKPHNPLHGNRSVSLTRRRWLTAVGGAGVAAMFARPARSRNPTNGVLHVPLRLAFLHDSEALPDTSGSAGLAAALARAHRAGWLNADARAAAQRTLKGLAEHLAPDGLLGGAAQSNKGGDGLQQGDYRVLYQMGMGLKAQLMAALEA